MRMIDLIKKKQDRLELTDEEIKFMVEGFTIGEIPDYQMSAMLMAIYFCGMSDKETATLTMAMVDSGDKIDLSEISGIKVDKHSTGGVGDTTSLILAPMVAALGIPVAKMSGRGLGHTGGTLDKLESFVGFNIELEKQQFIEIVKKDSIALMGQSGNMTPADKKLYELRDVTSTVMSIPLIASSIMSKKIASGADAIVLDVKVGAGAFMKNITEARKLAKAMVDIGKLVGRNTMAVISDMSQPLGLAIGNSLEIKEAINTLKGNGAPDMVELVYELGSHMVMLAKKAKTKDEARKKLEEVIKNGQALEKFKTLIANQGGDARAIDDISRLPNAKYVTKFLAKKDGFIAELVADKIGHVAMILGAGRQTKDAKIDLAVGIVLHKKVGDAISKGDVIASIHHNEPSISNALAHLEESIVISCNKPLLPKLFYDII